MIVDLNEPSAVRKAITEFRRLGREAFLEKHGYGRAKAYFVCGDDGELYDSKAIAGVAYGYQFPGYGPLAASDFSGGEATVKAVLERLGFVVIKTSASQGSASAGARSSMGQGTKATGPRIATICVEGSRAKSAKQNADRIAKLEMIVAEVNRRWSCLDAVVFPGGYLRLSQPIGQLPHPQRVAFLKKDGLVTSISNAARQATKSPGLVIVAGIDGPKPATGYGGDQLCVAWTEKGVTGIARKIFPVAGPEADALLCFDKDYRSPFRVVALPNGRTAALCACYDMFGVATTAGGGASQSRAVSRIGDHGSELRRGDPGFNGALTANIESFRSLLSSRSVSVGLAAIHGFEGHATSFWQRHGVATCSAALNGGYAFGAAHFEAGLPSAPAASTLAAHSVPPSHLYAAKRRKANSQAPIDHLTMDSFLIRLFA